MTVAIPLRGGRPVLAWSVPAFITLAVLGALIALTLQSDWKDKFVRQGMAHRQVILHSRAPPPVETPEFLLLEVSDARKFNAGIPLADAKPRPAQAFRFEGDELALARATDCLAAAAWYEAGDDDEGERAVVQVVLNRSRHAAFPSSICGVVFQGSERRTGCQFTFTCDGNLGRRPSAGALDRARRIAHDALEGKVDAKVGSATHYHADYVVPYWSGSLDKIAVVGSHIFYRWPGFWGGPQAFRRAAAREEPLIARLAFLSAAHEPGSAPADAASAALTQAALPGPMGSAVPLPTPPISDRALRGSVVQHASDGGDTFLLSLDDAAFAGNYAMTALALCKGKRTCRVLGWRDAAEVAQGLPLADAAAEALSFAYVKDLRRGVEQALWNCGQIAGRAAAQCLPPSASEIADLIRIE